MSDSTRRGRRKGTPEFPLFKHSRGYWCKTVKGKHHYFGRVDDDPDGTEALKLWNWQRDWLLIGETPPPYGQTASVTLETVCDHWIGGKDALQQAGDLAPRTYQEYFETCEILLGILGANLPATAIGPAQFDKVRVALAKRFNVNGQSKRITQIKSIFDTAYDDHVLTDRPNFGRNFKKPKAAAFRRHRASKGDQSYQPSEVRALLKSASVNMKPMILLGLQAGFGNSDCSLLPQSAVKGDWIEWPRVKNGIVRRVPLWKETRIALAKSVTHARELGEEQFCFVTSTGRPYGEDESATHHRVTEEFTRLRKNAKGANESRTFYDLRRTFETVAGETTDQVAVDAIMGHMASETNMPARYRQKISDERLEAVVTHVRKWLGVIE